MPSWHHPPPLLCPANFPIVLFCFLSLFLFLFLWTIFLLSSSLWVFILYCFVLGPYCLSNIFIKLLSLIVHLPPLFLYQPFMFLFPVPYSSLPLTTLLVILFFPVSPFFSRKCHWNMGQVFISTVMLQTWSTLFKQSFPFQCTQLFTTNSFEVWNLLFW